MGIPQCMTLRITGWERALYEIEGTTESTSRKPAQSSEVFGTKVRLRKDDIYECEQFVTWRFRAFDVR